MDQTTFCNDLINEIQSIFPDHVEFKTWSNKIKVSWKLNNDKSRPNKRSKTIIIIISEELFEDYCDSSESSQAAIKQNVKSYIEQKYKNFDPDHDTKRYHTTPVEKWHLTDVGQVGL